MKPINRILSFMMYWGCCLRGLFHANAKRICGQSFDYHIRGNMAIHAGANIAMAVQNFRNRGYAALGGIILNRRNVKREEEKVQELAEDFETKVIGKLTHSDLVTDAEEQGKTLMECYPESEMATEYRILAEQILNLCREDGLC